MILYYCIVYIKQSSNFYGGGRPASILFHLFTRLISIWPLLLLTWWFSSQPPGHRMTSDGSVRYPKPGFWKCYGKIGLVQVEQGFSSFSAKFLCHTYLMIFQSEVCQRRCETYKLQKSSLSNMSKIWQQNEEKPCSTCHIPIFQLILGTIKSNFRYPSNPSLSTYDLSNQ